MNKIRYIKIVIIGIIVLACFVFVMPRVNFPPVLSKYEIKSNKVPDEFDGFRIAQISDFHNADFGNNNTSLLKLLVEAEPDIIVITGDMIDSRRTDIDCAIHFTESLVKIAPTYYANGNHESRLSESEYEQMKTGFEKAGVIILEDDFVDITVNNKNITLIGIIDQAFEGERADDEMKHSIAHQLDEVVPQNDNYKVLLAHRPEYFDVYAGRVDLVFSGHAHGGQIIVPFVGGIFAPGQGFFPQYYAGTHIKENTEMVVSRGIGNSLFPIRINNRPEIIVAELKNI